MKKLITVYVSILISGSFIFGGDWYLPDLELTAEEVNDALAFNEAGYDYRDYLHARRLNLDPENYRVYRQNRQNRRKGAIMSIAGTAFIIKSVQMGVYGAYALKHPDKALTIMDERTSSRHINWSEHMNTGDVKNAGIALMSASGAVLVTGVILNAAGISRWKRGKAAVTRKDGIKFTISPFADGGGLSLSSEF